MRKSLITAQMCNLDQISPAQCDYLADDLISAVETAEDETFTGLKIRMCKGENGVECPYQEPIETRVAPVLNGRYAIALGKPVPQSNSDGGLKKYASMKDVSLKTCQDAILQAVLKERLLRTSLPAESINPFNWVIGNDCTEETKIFRNNSWGPNGYRADVSLADNSFIDVKISEMEDFPF